MRKICQNYNKDEKDKKDENLKTFARKSKNFAKILPAFLLIFALIFVATPNFARAAGATTEAERGACETQGGTFTAGVKVGDKIGEKADGTPITAEETDVKDSTCFLNGKDLNKSSTGNINNIIHTVINVLLFIIGTLSVIMIIYAGIRYVISRGKDDEVKGAKNTILYAVVGLVISMIAFAIVQFVFSSMSK